MDIYAEMVAAGVPVDNHESDLYVPVNARSLEIVAKYQFRKQVKAFRSAIDGTTWLDIPLAFTPYWTAKGVR